MKGLKEDCRLQTAVDYLTDYTGVIGAVIADHEGLVIACSPPSLLHGETYAALGPEIFNIADRIIEKIINPGCRYVSLKTDDRWLTIAATMNFHLVVLADQKADDLLNVRIQRTLEMITNHIKEKYPAEVYTVRPEAIKKEEAMEASHV
ncbi:MAG: roadblock/LC7 domain-containing protein [Candidatus Zixiibacteriota bacterium]|nr:MAG: roadblock/LC7 domain-containing protein [candidate division Zixibacteria bacterium]